MGDKTGINWTDATWNPVTGCTKLSAGCAHCYAEPMAKRLQAMGQPNYANGFKVTLQPHMLELPLRWTRPRRIFVNSMSDLFHEDVPDKYIDRVLDVARRAHWHTFQVLTKRTRRLIRYECDRANWPKNLWLGVTVEDASCWGRIEALRQTTAAVRFLSIEPLLGPLPELYLRDIGWVIVGGESGPNARPMDPAWVRAIRDECVRDGVPFFFKQWGGVQKKAAGRELDGRTWDEMPR